MNLIDKALKSDDLNLLFQPYIIEYLNIHVVVTRELSTDISVFSHFYIRKLFIGKRLLVETFRHRHAV